MNNNNLNNNFDIEKKLKEAKTDIPESIMPENVKKRLDKISSSKNKHTKYPIYIGKAAAVFLAICIPIFASQMVKQMDKSYINTNNQIISGQSNIPNNDDASPDTNSQKNTLTTECQSNAPDDTSNYEKIYKMFKNYKKQMYKRQIYNDKKDSFTASYDNDYIMINDSYEHGTGSISSTSSSEDVKYSSTNTRTQSIDEGDIVKTDGSYIYELINNTNTVNIYKAEGKNIKKASEIQIGKSDNITIYDMYVKDNRLIIIFSQTFETAEPPLKNDDEDLIKKMYEKDGGDFSLFNKKSWENISICCDTYIIANNKNSDSTLNVFPTYTRTYVYDITDKNSPEIIHRFFQDGNYISSRMADNTLYLFSDRNINIENVKKNNIETYIPQVGGECISNEKLTPVDSSLEDSYHSYTVLASINTDNCEYIDKAAVFGSMSRSYVSENNIYFFYSDYTDNTEKTVIEKLPYDNGTFGETVSGSIKGYILDDYCIDENNGYVRIVSTYYSEKNYKPHNCLYILNSNLEKTGKIKDIAVGETIYSARFIGNTAYFVTYRNTDPLFAADLTDPNNPEIIGYIKLPGFSKYLHPYGDNMLLGIGQETDEETGDFKGLKLSMFDISDRSNIKEIDKKVLSNYNYAEAMYNPNALFIDTDKNIFGFGADLNDFTSQDYLVFSYDEQEGFIKKLKQKLTSKSELKSRGLYIDNDFYVVNVGKEITCYEQFLIK